MMAHVHPSVSAMAQTLVTGIPIDYSGDPLQDLSTTSFLDQFIMKKPKVPLQPMNIPRPFNKPRTDSSRCISSLQARLA